MHRYNASYSNGHGKEIGESGRAAYFQAVASDRYGYNGVKGNK